MRDNQYATAFPIFTISIELDMQKLRMGRWIVLLSTLIMTGCFDMTHPTVEVKYILPQEFSMAPYFSYQDGSTFYIVAKEEGENTAEGAEMRVVLYSTEDFEEWTKSVMCEDIVYSFSTNNNRVTLVTTDYSYRNFIEVFNTKGKLISRRRIKEKGDYYAMSDSEAYLYSSNTHKIYFYKTVDGNIITSESASVETPDSVSSYFLGKDQIVFQSTKKHKINAGPHYVLFNVQTGVEESLLLPNYSRIIEADIDNALLYLVRESELLMYDFFKGEILQSWNISVENDQFRYTNIHKIPNGLLLTHESGSDISTYFIFNERKEELGLGKYHHSTSSDALFTIYAPTGSLEDGWKHVVVEPQGNLMVEAELHQL